MSEDSWSLNLCSFTSIDFINTAAAEISCSGEPGGLGIFNSILESMSPVVVILLVFIVFTWHNMVLSKSPCRPFIKK